MHSTPIVLTVTKATKTWGTDIVPLWSKFVVITISNQLVCIQCHTVTPARALSTCTCISSNVMNRPSSFILIPFPNWGSLEWVCTYASQSGHYELPAATLPFSSVDCWRGGFPGYSSGSQAGLIWWLGGLCGVKQWNRIASRCMWCSVVHKTMAKIQKWDTISVIWTLDRYFSWGWGGISSWKSLSWQ